MQTRTPKAVKKRVMSSVGATLAFEGLKPSSHARGIGKEYLEDRISGQEAIARIKAKHATKFGV